MRLTDILLLTSEVMTKLVPIAILVYRAANNQHNPSITKENALEMIIAQASLQGLMIGNTEAELARSAVHLAEAKKGRHKQYIQ